MEITAAQALALGLAMVALCTIHLVAGFFIGTRLAVQRRATAVQSPDLESVLHLVERSQELNFQLATQVRDLPERVMLAATQLLQATDAVRRELPVGTRTARAPECTRVREQVRSPSPPCGAALPSVSHISETDLAELMSETRISAARSHPAARSERKSYPVRQHVGFFSGQLPDGEAFETVLCNDISVEGISFFLDRPPDTDTLVISLGTTPQLTFMLAQVVNQRSFLSNGGESYRIGCRFLSKLDKGKYRWNPKTGGVEASHLLLESAV